MSRMIYITENSRSSSNTSYLPFFVLGCFSSVVLLKKSHSLCSFHCPEWNYKPDLASLSLPPLLVGGYCVYSDLFDVPSPIHHPVQQTKKYRVDEPIY